MSNHCPHTATFRGKRVLVILRDGTRIIDRFLDRTDRKVLLKDYGWIPKSKLRALAPYREAAGAR